MTIDEDRKKDRLKTDRFAVFVWKLTFCDQRDHKLTQGCVYFTNPSIILLVPPSVTCEYHSKVHELHDLLQCIVAYLHRTLTGFSGDTQNLGIFSAKFQSRFVAGSCKPIKCMLDTPLRRCKQKQHQIVHKKQTVDPATSNNDILVDLAVTSYPVHIIDQGRATFSVCVRKSPKSMTKFFRVPTKICENILLDILLGVREEVYVKALALVPYFRAPSRQFRPHHDSVLCLQRGPQ